MRRLLLVLGLFACRSRSEPPPPHQTAPVPAAPAVTIATAAIDPPAAPGAVAPWLTADRAGVLATWLEPDGTSSHRLVWSRWDGNQWAKPVVIAAGATIVANWADVPSIVRGNDGALVAHWAEKREGAAYAYDAIVARSSDDGVTWQRLGALHDDGTATEHGFVSLIADGSAVRAFWLDGRATAAGGPMALRTAMVGTTIGASEVVDDRVCDCCSTGAIAATDGAIVVYRDRTGQEIRDISAITRRDDRWSAPRGVDRDNWSIDGCPVNGPAIAAHGRRLAVAWFTGADQAQRARLAFSDDGGTTFRPAIEVDAARDGRTPLGRVDVVLADDQTAIASWLAAQGPRASLLVRRIGVDGTRGRELPLAETSSGRESGFPRVVRLAADLLVMWTEVGSASKLRALKVPVEAVPSR